MSVYIIIIVERGNYNPIEPRKKTEDSNQQCCERVIERYNPLAVLL